MKITDIKVHLPLGLLRIQTDAGIEGLSDGCGATCAEFIQQVYRPELLGQDPFHREVIWQRLMHLERLRYPPRQRLSRRGGQCAVGLGREGRRDAGVEALGRLPGPYSLLSQRPRPGNRGRVRGRCPARTGARLQGLQGPLLAWPGSDD